MFGSGANAMDTSLEQIKILFIGNSYTHMNDMPFIFKKIAKKEGKNVLVEMNTENSATFNIHSQRKSVYKSINKRKWDIVIFQGFSRELSTDLEIIDSTSLPYFTTLIDSVRINNPCTKVLLYNTWGYKDGYKYSEDINTYTKMSNRVLDGYHYISGLFDIAIVPVGQVWKNTRVNYPNLNLYTDDGQHPNLKGSYLAASTFYSSIFREHIKHSFGKARKDVDFERIKQLASSYTLENFDIYRLNDSFYTIQSMVNKDNNFIVVGEVSYKNVKSVVWNFGDGYFSIENVVSHKYTKAGKYTVELSIETECGTTVHRHLCQYEKEKKRKYKFRRRRRKSSSIEKEN